MYNARSENLLPDVAIFLSFKLNGDIPLVSDW